MHTPHEACLHCDEPTLDPRLQVRDVMDRAQQYIECPCCGARGPSCATKREAWAAWNRRSPSPANVPGEKEA